MRVNPGLEGVIVADTEISYIDGQSGILIYRGYEAKQLALHRSYEEVVYLLWKGRFPDSAELDAFNQALWENQRLTEELKQIIKLIPPDVDMMSVIRAALSSLGDRSFGWPPSLEKAVSLLAITPAIIAARYRHLQGKPIVEPIPNLSFAANYLLMIHGKKPHPAHIRALESYFTLAAEHGLNASTFTARVVASTEADLSSAIIAALGALKGPLHGGAPSEVEGMLEQIGSLEEAEKWMRERLRQGEKLMGFGHRIYKTTDPRAEALRQVVQTGSGAEPWFQFAVEVEKIALALLKEVKPHRQIHTNVEYYTAAILKAIQLPKLLYTPTFAVTRIAGWIAHILEQAKNNRIIRPTSNYIGSMD
ncbi:citrate synthase [Paenactinomyces guangxiensis]|uniref:Citrate synthase n=1 Tax=Paenactinomyces guangxiensis TaxID=1490290 RepID=A0A7W1WMX9_9BACL|nr:citrate synthase/methylcitrate synthase [Paenactinomyces guangxiensis]MBA4492882.1 citrate synthase/methylcitrate synthase [Paenactinomyces guangxiensis]MBH8590270.1 citrate synthase/methylcitrate synthase [Paenactinomyces guangxiensis]